MCHGFSLFTSVVRVVLFVMLKWPADTLMDTVAYFYGSLCRECSVNEEAYDCSFSIHKLCDSEILHRSVG